MKKKYFCKECKGYRNHSEIHKVERRGQDEDGFFQWIEKFLIIECNGCDSLSFLKIYGDTTMTEPDEDGYPDYYDEETIYPYYLRESYEIENKHYLPEKLRKIYVETINALKSNSYILTAGGFRAIIEALCNHLKIRKDNLEERINLLSKKGHLTVSESKRLHSIRFLGNDALHEIEIPKKEHLYLLLDIINHLLTNLFINDKKLKGQLETVVDSGPELCRLVKSKISEEMVGNEFSLKEIIGKSKRLIPKGKIDELESHLINNIKTDKFNYLEIVKEEDEKRYKILVVPNPFDLDLFLPSLN